MKNHEPRRKNVSGRQKITKKYFCKVDVTLDYIFKYFNRLKRA
jgi:hypothetical protein